MPTCGAGQGRRVVHAVAGHGHDAAFLLRDARRRRPSGRAAPRPPPRRCRAGAPRPPPWCGDRPVSMTIRRPSRVKALDRLGRRLLHRIGHGHEARRRAVEHHEHDGAALAPQRLGALAERAGLDAELLQQRRGCRARRAAARRARARRGPPATRSPPTSSSASPRASAPATMAAASGCSLPRSRLAASRSTSFASTPATGSTSSSRGLPSVSVPVLSTTSVSTSRRSSMRLGVCGRARPRWRRGRTPP